MLTKYLNEATNQKGFRVGIHFMSLEGGTYPYFSQIGLSGY